MECFICIRFDVILGFFVIITLFYFIIYCMLISQSPLMLKITFGDAGHVFKNKDYYYILLFNSCIKDNRRRAWIRIMEIIFITVWMHWKWRSVYAFCSSGIQICMVRASLHILSLIALINHSDRLEFSLESIEKTYTCNSLKLPIKGHMHAVKNSVTQKKLSYLKELLKL